ncbi:MAG: marine proteobacterial sortase target protein [Rhizobiales bacterium]|nr:marine proteobacterial sortase target protein [Hyphomicrobiales bacterium]
MTMIISQTRPATPHRLAGFFVSFVAYATLALTAFDFSTPARADTRGDAPAGLVRLNDVESGALLLKSKEPGKYVPAPLLATDVEIDVTGPMARTRVTQRFINPGDGWVEGKYVFPLPDNSAVDTLKMMIGDRVIEGQIKEKKEARQIYEEAKASGKKASLVEQQRPNVFTNSVANIGPNENIVIQIEYQQTVKQDKNTFSLRFPMVVAPRYTPQSAVPQMVDFAPGSGWGELRAPEETPADDNTLDQPPVLHPDMGKVNPVALKVTLNAGFPLGDIESPHHKIKLTRDGKDKAHLTLADEVVPADKDFELVWKTAKTTAPSAALFREHVGNEDYVLVMLTPPEVADLGPAKPREAVFVIDNSGSMAGTSMDQAKESLLYALDDLTPGDTFNVIRFDDSLTVLFPQAVRADQENIATARHFVSSLSADGGTEMLPALKASLVDRRPNDDSHVRQVIFLTDGAIANERELFAEITQHLGRSRLFTVGIGAAPNTYFMSRAAEAGRGTFTHIGESEQVVGRMKELLAKLRHPVMTNITANWPDGMESESWPNPIPDLYAGEPIIVSARMPKAAGTLVLKGEQAGKPWEVHMTLDAGDVRPGIGKLWARRKIQSLEADALLGGNQTSIDQAILKTALDHHLVSRLTSLVAVDVTPTRPDGSPLVSKDMPVNLPEGWDFEKVFGEQNVMPTQAKRAMQGAPAPMLAMVAAPIMADASAANMPLPQTASDAPLLILQGLLALIAALGLYLLWWIGFCRMARIDKSQA